MKAVICLQFHGDDKLQAMRLARLLADIEPAFRDDVELCFVVRFDCEHDSETQEYCAKKFNVSQFKTTTPWTGWPSGPNGMAVDVLRCMAMRVTTGQISKNDVMILLEPDCVPVRREWINVLKHNWQCFAMHHDIWIMGAWRNSGHADGHLNGNLVCRPDLASLIDLSCIGKDLAWDCAIVPQTLKNRWIIYEIKNCFQSIEAMDQSLLERHANGTQPCLVHGYKDDSAYNIARRLLL